MDTPNGQSKHYQVPKATHPWRNYKNRTTPDTEESVKADKELPSLFHFLKDMVDNWETYTIPTSEMEEHYGKIKSQTKVKQAEWITSFIRKTWVRKEVLDIYV